MSSTREIVRIEVPGQREALVPPSAARVRALKRHLIEAFRDLAAARRPERLIQARTPEPDSGKAAVLAGACAHCAGSCCMAGGTHAFIDERTLARVLAERPWMGRREVVAAYAGAVARLGYARSCLFHGAGGCTLERGLRAELCNSYYCNGLQPLLAQRLSDQTDVVVRTHAGEERTLRG